MGKPTETAHNSKTRVGLDTVANLLAESGFCIWIIVDLLRDTSMAWWLKIILWCAAACVLFLIAYNVYIKIWHKKRSVFGLYGIAIASLLVIGLYRHELPPKLPHLTFWLNIGELDDIGIALTNTFLLTESDGTNFPVLLVPKKEGQTNFSFHFAAHNDSKVPVEDVLFIAEFSQDWKRLPDKDWKEFRRLEPVPNPKSVDMDVFQAVAIEPHALILPGNAMTLPTLTLSNESEQELCNLYIFARTKEHTLPGVTFSVGFVPPSKGLLHKPQWQIVHPQADGTTHLRPIPD